VGRETEIATRVWKDLESKGVSHSKEVAESIAFAMVESGVKSDPPSGCKKVINIYYDPGLAKYVMEREE